ncbi:phosphopantetheine-binding protein [Corynebacterium macclintockiae]|uniref:Putative isochorismatase n=1 Tax=Corynebacterium jeikeium (strain K411) TaxID=306537 RepID=Q4JT59_CORJK|nr:MULTISPECIES: phosphopantetheine-binding protein [Corynebacterium]MCG7455880.1 phosphopantetheine-binding protein [Corynebacterium sp. ACRPH]MDK8890806.1 phosphopantetheine-binding protein [Corynebacterium macclintockiae]CAI37998.1 putative isochorismatase [Corynebacterium jeikeium K411]SQI19376.1 isochorismatase [Corynebacterium jeikeium]SUY84647.1 isochorismatase [Corynebacterium jeikeium]
MEPITEDQLRGCVAETMKMEPAEIEVSEELYDQGMNSLQLVTVLTWLQEKGYDVSFADLAEDTRLTAWIELLDI